MIQDIQKELTETMDQLQGLKRIQEHLRQINKRLDTAYKTHAKLEKQYDKEKKEFEQLEKLSLRSVFFKVLGNKESQLEKERQEYLEAAMSYNENVKSIELLEYEKNLLEKKISQTGVLEDKLESLIKEKEKRLLALNSGDGAQVIKITRQISVFADDLREVSDLVVLGKECLDILKRMIRYLESARNWGNWDMMSRRGYVGYIKHSNIDRARDLAYKAKMLLTKFEDRLAHYFPDRRYNLGFQMDMFSRFTDIFFDNLLSDWIIQSKIRNSLSSVITAHDRVLRIVRTCENEKIEISESLIELEQKRRAIIISA